MVPQIARITPCRLTPVCVVRSARYRTGSSSVGAKPGNTFDAGFRSVFQQANSGTDVVVLGPEGRIFVTGPDVVRSVTGEDVDMLRLGGPEVLHHGLGTLFQNHPQR